MEWVKRRAMLLSSSTVVAIALLGGPAMSFAANQNVDGRINKLEQRIEQLQKQVGQPRGTDWKAMEKRLEKLERKQPASQGGETGNMVFFRGGGAYAASDRSNEVYSDVLSGLATGDTGFYVGAGLDLVMSKNVWGMMSGTWVLGEIGVELKKYESKTASKSGQAAAFSGTASVAATDKIEITQLTVSISPKIMFMEGSRLRPWIIPVGLDFNVISPPSSETTYLDIGAQFGVGAHYRLWKAFHLGVDARYHLAAGWTDTDNSFGTVGTYVGIAF